jgi:ATP-dependent DNA helicase RecG
LEDFEVKVAQGGVPKSSCSTVSAFSNTSGGWLIFGIGEKENQFILMRYQNNQKIKEKI